MATKGVVIMKMLSLLTLMIGVFSSTGNANAWTTCSGAGGTCGISGCPSTFLCESKGCKLCRQCKEAGNDITIIKIRDGVVRISCGDIFSSVSPDGNESKPNLPTRAIFTPNKSVNATH
jgi:hypothetical protein